MRNNQAHIEKPALRPDIEETSSQSFAAAKTAPLLAENIQRMTQEELLSILKSRGYCEQWGIFELPEELRTRNNAPSYYRVNFTSILKSHAKSEDELQLGIITLGRMLLLSTSVPCKMAPNQPAIPLAPQTAFTILKGVWARMVKSALAKPVRDDGKLLARLRPSECVSWRQDTERRRFDYYTNKNYWDDAVTQTDGEVANAKSLRGRERPRPEEKPKGKGWLPLPDSLVHAAGQRAGWITTHLSPVLLDLFEEVTAVRRGRTAKINIATAGILDQVEWSNVDGKDLTSLPFDHIGLDWPPKNWESLCYAVQLVQQSHYFIVCLSAGPRSSEVLSFNTDCLIEDHGGIAVARGRTYKIVDPVAGAQRDWPLPKMAVLALHHQVRLSKLVSIYVEQSRWNESLGRLQVKINWEVVNNRLTELGWTPGYASRACGFDVNFFYPWRDGKGAHLTSVGPVAKVLGLPAEQILADPADAVRINLNSQAPSFAQPSISEPLWRVLSSNHFFGWPLAKGHNNELRDLVATLGLQDLMDKQGLAVHRFRKTIGRLVALCYAHAPQIMMDIYGHEDIDMTLHYLLTDDTLLAEIEQSRREITVMRAERVIENVESCGGKGAKRLQEVVSRFKSGEQDYGVSNTHEMAVLLTNDGQLWDAVRKGILCIKGQNETAVCARGSSVANKGKCQAGCEHQVLDPLLEREYDESIADCVTYLEEALAKKDHVMTAMWGGQILNKISEFNTLYAKWKLHPLVAKLIVDRDQDEMRPDAA